MGFKSRCKTAFPWVLLAVTAGACMWGLTAGMIAFHVNVGAAMMAMVAYIAVVVRVFSLAASPFGPLSFKPWGER